MTGLSSATPIDLVLAVGVLILTLAVGTVAHEFAHAAILRALGVPFDVSWLPDRRGSDRPGFSGRWATVTPRRLPRGLPPWGLRLAAIAPFVLATPMALVFVGVLPDPTLTGNLPLVAATMAWFACALPSPQDFSLFWYAERAIDEYGGSTFTGERGRA